MEKDTITLTPKMIKALELLKALREKMREIPTYLLYLEKKSPKK